MITVSLSKIINYIEEFFPLKTAFPDDKCGLEIGNLDTKIQKIIIGLDLNSDLLQAAMKSNNTLVILHHPFLWYETLDEELIHAPYKKKMLEKIKKHQISIYALHTSYNNNELGMPTNLFNTLNFKKIKNDNLSSPYLSFFEVNSAYTLSKFTEKIKKCFKLNSVEIFNPKKINVVTKVCFLPGKGSIEFILEAQKHAPDFIITSDVKWSEWMTIQEMSIPIINISHSMENIFAEHIKALLSKKINLEIEVIETQHKYKVFS